MEQDSVLASDAERDTAVDHLSTACAEGRLTLGEFADRAAEAHAARTRGDLQALVNDLPFTVIVADGVKPWAHAATPGAAVEAIERSDASRERDFCLVGAISRRGRWKIARDTRIVTLIGGTDLDLSQASISHPEVRLRIVSIIGRIDVTVPRGVRVQIRARSPIGGRDIDVDDTGPDSPVIRLSAHSLVGGVQIRSKQPDK